MMINIIVYLRHWQRWSPYQHEQCWSHTENLELSGLYFPAFLVQNRTAPLIVNSSTSLKWVMSYLIVMSIDGKLMSGIFYNRQVQFITGKNRQIMRENGEKLWSHVFDVHFQNTCWASSLEISESREERIKNNLITRRNVLHHTPTNWISYLKFWFVTCSSETTDHCFTRPPGERVIINLEWRTD